MALLYAEWPILYAENYMYQNVAIISKKAGFTCPGYNFNNLWSYSKLNPMPNAVCSASDRNRSIPKPLKQSPQKTRLKQFTFLTFVCQPEGSPKK